MNPNRSALVAGLAGVAALTAVLSFVVADVKAAGKRLTAPTPTAATATPAAAVAEHAEAPYCTPQFKEVLRRVVDACGLVGEGDRRGCAPVAPAHRPGRTSSFENSVAAEPTERKLPRIAPRTPPPWQAVTSRRSVRFPYGRVRDPRRRPRR